MSRKTCRIEVKRDYLSKVAHASVDKALAELIWNALDAEATRVEVQFVRDALSTQQISVIDNGWGFPKQHAEGLFGSLGGSWKMGRSRTTHSRVMHGKQGQGRLKPLSLGRCVSWSVRHQNGDGSVDTFQVQQYADNLQEFVIDDEVCVHTYERGVTVTISELFREERLFDPQEAAEKLLPIFALYLRSYVDTQIIIGGVLLNPDMLIEHTELIDLGSVNFDGKDYPATLKLIEWRGKSNKELWLCNAAGYPIEKSDRKIKVSGFEYSAYLQSDLIDDLNSKALLGLSDLNDSLRELTDRASKSIRDYFSKLCVEQAQHRVDLWQKEDVYPYKHEASSKSEREKRQLFDNIALQLSEDIKSLRTADRTSKAFQLRLLRYVIDQNPNDLQVIMQEVLGQSNQEQLELIGVLGKIGA